MSSNTKKKVEIVKVKHLSEDELISRLRNVTMLQDESTRPYENAFISLENICIEDLFPPQRYVLKQELLKVRELKWRLEEHGIDLFQLNGFVRITLAGESEPIDLLPPVIEERIEKNGRVAHIINDGMHRIYTAYLEWVIPQVILCGVCQNISPIMRSQFLKKIGPKLNSEMTSRLISSKNGIGPNATKNCTEILTALL